MCQNRGIKTKIYKETGVSTHWEKILTILPSKSHTEGWPSEDKSRTSDISTNNPRGQRSRCDGERENKCSRVLGEQNKSITHKRLQRKQMGDFLKKQEKEAQTIIICYSF